QGVFGILSGASANTPAQKGAAPAKDQEASMQTITNEVQPATLQPQVKRGLIQVFAADYNKAPTVETTRPSVAPVMAPPASAPMTRGWIVEDEMNVTPASSLAIPQPAGSLNLQPVPANRR